MKKPLQKHNMRQPRRNFFRQWRDYLGLTQERALDRLEWSQSKLSRIESGATMWNGYDLADLEQAYGISAELLLNVDPSKEGEVVDLMRLIQEKDLAVVRAIVAGLPAKSH